MSLEKKAAQLGFRLVATNRNDARRYIPFSLSNKHDANTMDQTLNVDTEHFSRKLANLPKSWVMHTETRNNRLQ